MILLRTKGKPSNIQSVVLGTVVSNNNGEELTCYSAKTKTNILLSTRLNTNPSIPSIENIPSLDHLQIGDIVLLTPFGNVTTIFRKESHHNSLFITDRCNSNCLMCSQPPRNYDDLDYFFHINSELITILPDTLENLGITGGEPTLLGSRFITLLALLKQYVPNTNIHILTNGRSFAWKHVTESISQTYNSRLIWGVPLYSDYYQQHDYIVQAKDAFNQTALGLHNMARFGLRVEIRIVLHKQSYKRLYSLAKFIFKNFPFVEHVAFMGLEYVGYTIKNADLLWIEPKEYSEELESAILFLDSVGITTSIYNLPLCLVKPTLWEFVQKSISDWKRNYLPECANCDVINECGGIFETSKKHSVQIKAIKH